MVFVNMKIVEDKNFALGRIQTHNLMIYLKNFLYIPIFQLKLLVPFVSCKATFRKNIYNTIRCIAETKNIK